MMTEPSRDWYGLELMKASGLPSGTLYPLLHRLVGDGWLVKMGDAPSEAGGPSRRLYRLTALGATEARTLVPVAPTNKRRQLVAPRVPGFAA